jgi:hypothetical protein
VHSDGFGFLLLCFYGKIMQNEPAVGVGVLGHSEGAICKRDCARERSIEMRSEDELIERLKMCINKLGNEFHEGSDDYFWWEADYQHVLLSCLRQDREFWYVFTDEDGRKREVPLVHANCPAKDGKMRYDIALYEPDVA